MFVGPDEGVGSSPKLWLCCIYWWKIITEDYSTSFFFECWQPFFFLLLDSPAPDWNHHSPLSRCRYVMCLTWNLLDPLQVFLTCANFCIFLVCRLPQLSILDPTTLCLMLELYLDYPTCCKSPWQQYLNLWAVGEFCVLWAYWILGVCRSAVRTPGRIHSVVVATDWLKVAVPGGFSSWIFSSCRRRIPADLRV